MGKKNEGKLKELSELFFIRITRNKAKERINKEFKSYKEKEEIKIGEKFSKEETKSLRKDFFETRGREIIKEEAKKARSKATVLALVGALGIGGVVGYTLGTRNSEILGITEGEKGKIEIDMGEVTGDLNIRNEEENKDKRAIFVDGLKYQAPEEQEPTKEEIIAEEIRKLDSAEEIDEYLANLYIEAYEQQTGDKKLNTSDIQINENYESYIYVLDDGQLVSHGDLPYETEKQIKADGKSISGSIDDNVRIYYVKLTETGKTIDEMTTNLERVIPGENYTEMKDNDSVLCDIAEITERSFELKKVLKELKNDSNNEYIRTVYQNTQNELAKAVNEFYDGKEAQEVEESRKQETEEDERET